MDRFVSNATLRIHSKGRVSIPVSFRSVLGHDGFDGLFCYPALDWPAIDGGGNALMVEIEALIGRFPPFPEQHERLALALFGTGHESQIWEPRRFHDELGKATDTVHGVLKAELGSPSAAGNAHGARK